MEARRAFLTDQRVVCGADCSLSLSLSLSHTHTHTLSLSLTLSHSLSLSLAQAERAVGGCERGGDTGDGWRAAASTAH
jgi:hypothetical protein